MTNHHFMIYISTLSRDCVNTGRGFSFVNKFVQNESFGHIANCFCNLELTSILLGNTGDVIMPDTDLIDTLNDAESYFKHGIEQLIYTIKLIHSDVENLTVKTFRPDKLTAQALLEYIGMEECKAKKNMEILCSKEIKQFLKWVDNYCEENECTQEDVLNKIINEEV